jgi:hypothetical protein
MWLRYRRCDTAGLTELASNHISPAPNPRSEQNWPIHAASRMSQLRKSSSAASQSLNRFNKLQSHVFLKCGGVTRFVT